MSAAAPTALAGFGEVAARYDAFFVDQFGVLHDGQSPYPDALDTLQRLRGAGKQVVLLSNSGKRSARNEARLERLGFSRNGWDHFLSSGEVAWANLRDQLASGGTRWRCLLLARDDDRSAIDGLPIDYADDAAACDLVLIAGSEGDRLTLDQYRALLAPAAERGVPAICTNPDTHMLTEHGLRFGAGHIAALYVQLGGQVTLVGKPHPAIYAAARATIGAIAPNRILCVGDSIDHDIAGAQAAGLDGCLVIGGVHHGASQAELAALYAQASATPTFILPAFRW